MKLSKRFIAMMLSLIITMNFLTHNAAYILAHNGIQDVTYDNCNGMPTGDGVEEMWYVLERNSISKH